MTTMSDLVAQTRRDYLLGGLRESRNRLTNSVAVGDTSIAFDFDLASSKIAPGARLSIGFEEIGVWEINAGTKTATTVQRGDYSSVAQGHSAGAIVYVNSAFSPLRVYTAMLDEVDALSSAGLFRMRTVDLTYDSSVRGYDLTSITDLIDVYEVRAKTTGPENDWPLLDSWTVARNMPTTSFASGTALIFKDPGEDGQTLRVKYMAPFNVPTIALPSSDLQADVGMPSTADDLVKLGTAIRVQAPREIKRNMVEHQGDTRRAEEVPTGAQLQSVRGLLALYERRLVEERVALLRRYPPRKRRGVAV